MGLDVRITEVDFLIPQDNLDEALSIWKSMNTHPAYAKLKRSGRRMPGGLWSNFSWLDEDYDQFVESAEDMLDDLGFYVQSGEYGVRITGYDNKQGQEELFLRAIEHLVAPNSYIEWWANDGGSGETWTEHYNN